MLKIINTPFFDIFEILEFYFGEFFFNGGVRNIYSNKIPLK